MTWIKALLIVSFLCLLGWGFRHRAHVGLRAGMRLAAIALTGAAIASVINPDLLTSAANDVGVTRGTDLVLYIFIVIFVATTIGTYFRFRAQERRLVDIVRAMAIRDAIMTEGLPGAETSAAQSTRLPENGA
jgi:small membrane protein